MSLCKVLLEVRKVWFISHFTFFFSWRNSFLLEGLFLVCISLQALQLASRRIKPIDPQKERFSPERCLDANLHKLLCLRAENIQLVSNTLPRATQINTYTNTHTHSRKVPRLKRVWGRNFCLFSLTAHTLRAAKAIPLMSSTSVKKRVGVCFWKFTVITVAIIRSVMIRSPLHA